MARAALRWSLVDLSQASAVSVATLNRFEKGGDAYKSTLDKVRAELERAGVRFIEADAEAGEGVRLV